MPEAGASMAIVETRASGVARPIAIAVNTSYPTCVYTGAPTAVTSVQNNHPSTNHAYLKHKAEEMMLRDLAD